MPWSSQQRIEWALQDFSERYHLQWRVPKDGTSTPDDVERRRAAQRVLGIPESKIDRYPFEQLYGTNDDGDGGWIWHPSLYWTGPNPVQNKLRLARHDKALAYFRATHGPIYVFPVIGSLTENRTDRGVDLETHPGSKILAIGSGIVTAIPPASAISSLGQIVIALDRPYHGWRHAYCFHLANCHVKTGQRVHAGQLIATSSEHPPGAEDMPGHIEYGFALNGMGDIQDAHDASHNAPSGNSMHALLRQLNPKVIGSKPIIA